MGLLRSPRVYGLKKGVQRVILKTLKTPKKYIGIGNGGGVFIKEVGRKLKICLGSY